MQIFICDNCEVEGKHYAKQMCRPCYRKATNEGKKYWERARKNPEMMRKQRERNKRYWREVLKGTEEYNQRHSEAQKRWYKKNKHKRAAHKKARRALLRGDIKREWCKECGAEAEMHHPDYKKPLDVIWLCKDCHMKGHRILG